MTKTTQNSDNLNTKLTSFADELLSSLITGVLYQICAYTLAKVWLNYLPIAAPIALYYTLIFTLGTAIALNYENTTLETSGDRLPEIIATLKSDFASFISLIRSPSKATPKQAFSSSTKALQYLLIATAIYNIPALLSVVLSYLFLSFHFGQTKARTVMNIPLLAASSIFGLLLPYQNSILLLPLIATSAIIGILMYTSLQDFTKTKSSFKTKLFDASSKALDNLHKQLNEANSIDQVLLLTVFCSLLAAPMLSAVPYICIISEVLTSTSVLCTLSLFATIVLGSRLKLFLAPLVDETQDNSPEERPDLCRELVALARDSIMDMTTQTESDPTVPCR